MILKEIGEITVEDFQIIFDNPEKETKTIEFKRHINLDGATAKKEFLYDVCSFANTVGGDLIFGIDEVNGVEGFACADIDSLILQIEQIIRSNTTPNILYRIRQILLEQDKYILLLRIREGFQKPHMVDYSGTKKFYVRGEKGKSEMNYFELKNQFNSQLNRETMLNRFVNERIAIQISDEGPIPLGVGAKVCLHIIPVDNFIFNKQINMNEFGHRRWHPAPIDSRRNYVTERNFNGFLSYGKDVGFISYTQVFSNGAIEAINTSILDQKHSSGDYKLIPSTVLVKQLYYALYDNFEVLERLGMGFPVIIYLNLLGMKNYYLAEGNGFRTSNQSRINEYLKFRPLTIEMKPESCAKLLQPWFDHLWQAFGFPKCDLYDSDGYLRFDNARHI